LTRGRRTAEDGTTFSLLALSGRIAAVVVAGLAALPSGALAAPRAQLAELTASNGVAADTLANSVGVSGDGSALVAGSPIATVDGHDYAGRAYVFAKGTGGWADATQSTELAPSDRAEYDSFGQAVAISRDGSTVVVSSPYATVGANAGQGALYVFVKSGAAWAPGPQVAKLTAADGGANDALGFSVAVSDDGSAIVAGARSAPVGGHNGQGAVYVFERPGGGWADATQAGRLTASDGAEFDQLGNAVAISGDGSTVAAGAVSATDGALLYAGLAYVFERPGGGWADGNEAGRLTPSAPSGSQNFGAAVATDRTGSAIAVGAIGTQIESDPHGAVYVYARPGGVWADATQQALLSASDGASSDQLGASTAMTADGSRIVSGAPSATVGANANQGAVYEFARSGGGWADGTEDGKLVAADGASGDALGYSIALAADALTTVAGAPYAAGAKGAAYAFGAPSATALACDPAATIVGAATTCTATVTQTGTGPGAPTGPVGFASDSGGAFGTCALAPTASPGVSACQLAYSPAAVGTGTHALSAAYAGDAGHAGSQGTAAVGVTAPPGGGGGGGGPIIPPAPAVTKAVLKLTAPARQRLARQRAVIVTIRTDVAASVRVGGTLSIPGAAKVLRLARVTRQLQGGASAKVKLKLSAKRVRAIRRALRRHRRVVAKIRTTATNAAGTSAATRTIVARR
jgi:trimeric autotransporter adhesin